MRRLLLCAALPLLMGAAPADDEPRQVALTIYNGNLALVQEVRRLDLPAGRSRLEFKNVSTGIRPETVALSGGGLGIVEQNFDYDLLTPSKMMEKAVGKQIQIVRTNPGTGAETTATATVLSVNAGVILKIGDRIEVLRDDGIPTRVIFDGVPENLRARPTLSVTVNAPTAGARDATLSYLTSGLSWAADYVANYDQKAGLLTLQGWVTLTNSTDTSFTDVTPHLVAENFVQTVRSFQPAGNIGGVRTAGQGIANPAAPDSEDFPVYVLPEKVTVAPQQTKQVSFVEMPDVKAQKVYEYRSYGFSSNDAPAHVQTTIGLTNPKGMPAGTVRVYLRDIDGAAKFVGEQRLDAAPAGSELSLRLGQAFDVTVQASVVTSERIGDTGHRYVMRYDFRNARNDAVRVHFRQDGLGGTGNEVTNQSIPGQRIDAFSQEWDVPVPANGKTSLTFTTTTY